MGIRPKLSLQINQEAIRFEHFEAWVKVFLAVLGTLGFALFKILLKAQKR